MVAEPARAGSPVEVVLASVARYLLAEHALATAAVRGYVSHARAPDLGSEFALRLS